MPQAEYDVSNYRYRFELINMLLYTLDVKVFVSVVNLEH